MKWKRGDDWHQVSECGEWTINKTGGPHPIYMLVRGKEIAKVGTLEECRDTALQEQPKGKRK